MRENIKYSYNNYSYINAGWLCIALKMQVVQRKRSEVRQGYQQNIRLAKTINVPILNEVIININGNGY